MKLLYLFIILIILPFVFAENCNSDCIKEGYSFGSCRASCKTGELTISGGEDCLRVGEATLVIGTNAIDTYSNGEAYIGEDKADPEWVWVIKNLNVKTRRTDVSSTTAETQHTGPIIGIKNAFTADNIDYVDVNAKAVNEEYCLPDDYICVRHNGTSVNYYGDYLIAETTVDLSAENSSWSAKPAILIQSLSESEGIKTQITNYNVASISSDVKTDKIWIVYNNTGNSAGIYYEDARSLKQLAGYVTMNAVGTDINIADIHYYSTQNGDVEIDLRNDFAGANHINLTLDILGTEGAAATNGADDITINLKHGANSDFAGLGKFANTAEDDDLVWVSTNIGLKDENHRSLYGIIIYNPKAYATSDQVLLGIPSDQVKSSVTIMGKTTITETILAENKSTVLGEKAPTPILASELTNREDYNLLFVGGPCANPLLDTFENFPTCREWPLKRGEAMIKIVEDGDNIAMLVAGTTAEDTRMATTLLKNYGMYNLKGTSIKITKNRIINLINETRGYDLSDYPVPFVKNGKFTDTLFVVGNKASAKDTVGVVDITGSLMNVTRRALILTNETQTSTLKGTTSDEVALSNNLADSTFFSSYLTKSDINTLQDRTVTFGGDDYYFHDELMFYKGGPSIETSLSSTDDTYNSNIYMELLEGRLRYYYVFEEPIDLTTASTGKPLEIKFLNSYFKITDVDSTKFISQLATEYNMEVGDEVTVDNKKVKLINVGSGGEVIVEVNNTKEIIRLGFREFIQGLEIKNRESFYEGGKTCCCYDLLNFLK